MPRVFEDAMGDLVGVSDRRRLIDDGRELATDIEEAAYNDLMRFGASFIITDSVRKTRLRSSNIL
jgi:hypothetical protein